MDAEHFQQLIDQLKPIANEPEFDKIFQRLTQKEDGPTRFKLKATLKELAAPCQRVLDLRKRVDGQCRPYTINDRTHYLDDVAINILEQGLKLYNGVFTFDTYQQILNADNNLRVMHRRAQQQALLQRQQDDDNLASDVNSAVAEELKYPAHMLQFADYRLRREERMNFVIDVQLLLENGKLLDGVTTDISLSGLRLKLKTKRIVKFKDKQAVTIRFNGLAREFTIDPNMRVPYVLVNNDVRDHQQYVSLMLSPDHDNQAFSHFLTGFINGYKRRYKVNIDNTFETVETKAHEQFYLPRMDHLPIYFKRTEKLIYADMLLQTDNNRQLIDYWRDHRNQPMLGALFNGSRLKKLLASDQLEPYLVLYCFSITLAGKVVFYSATEEELEQHQCRDCYFSIGQRRQSWRVLRFSLSQADLAKAWQPLSVPEHIQQQSRERPPSAAIMKRLQGISHIGCLSDISATCRPAEISFNGDRRLELLRPFMHPLKLPFKTKDIPLEFVNLRREQRFSHRSKIIMHINQRSRDAITRDFSVRGLQIDSELPIHCHVGDELTVDLPDLQKLTKQFSLKQLPYTVVGRSDDGRNINLQTSDVAGQHPAEAFFNELIANNQTKLRQAEQSGQRHGLELCLRNLYCDAMMSSPLFIYKQQNQYEVGSIAFSQQPLNLAAALRQTTPGNRHDTVSLQMLFNDDILQQQLLPQLHELDRQSAPEQVILLVKLSPYGERPIQRWLFAEANDEKTAIVIQSARADDVLLAFQFSLTRTGQPDIEFITNELHYLAGYAAHKAKQLEQELWRVYGIIDVLEVTDAVLNALGQPAAFIDNQRQRRHQLFTLAATT